MNDDMYDQLRRAIIQILGTKPAPERRLQLVSDLRALAEQQERLAASAGHSRPAEPQPNADKRAPGTYVRINHEPDPQTGARRIRVSIGRQIWSDLGAPERIDVQRVGQEVWLVPITGRGGYPLVMGMSLPSAVVGTNAAAATLMPGRYAASIRAGAIVIGERVA